MVLLVSTCIVTTNFSLTLVIIFYQLSNHCWVSFSGFAGAFNDIYEDEVRQYGECMIEKDDGLEGKCLLNMCS